MFYKFLYLGFKIYCFLFRPIRMGVRVMMIEKDKVWLVRHTYLSGWYMPGGGIKKWADALTESQANTIIMAARASWFPEEPAQAAAG